MGAPAPPHGGEKKFFSGLITGKMCKCTPTGHEVLCHSLVTTPSHSKSQFLEVFAGWLRFGGRRLKKRSSTFLAKKCTPADKILVYAYVNQSLSTLQIYIEPNRSDKIKTQRITVKWFRMLHSHTGQFLRGRVGQPLHCSLDVFN